MSYESVRAHLSHTILGNAFFSYLSEPPSFWKMQKLSIDARAAELSGRWQEITSRPNSIRHSYRTWRGEHGDEKGIPALTWELYELGWQHPSFSPTSAFPSREKISGWLSDMENLMDALAAAGFIYKPDQEEKTRAFWTAGLKLYQFLQDTKFGSASFWTYFKGRR